MKIYFKFFFCKWKSKFIANKILNIKVCVGFWRITIKLNGRFSFYIVVYRLLSEVFFQYRLVLVLFGISALIYWVVETFQFRLLSCNILNIVCLISNLYLVNSKLLRSYSRLMVAPDELWPMWLTHRVVSDRVHRLLVTLSYFRPDRFVQLLCLILILISLLYLLVSGCLTSLC